MIRVQLVSSQILEYSDTRILTSSGQAPFVVVVPETAHHIQCPVCTPDGDGRVCYTIEGAGFYHRVVDHIFKHDLLSDFQRLVKGISLQEIAAQATHAAQPVLR